MSKPIADDRVGDFKLSGKSLDSYRHRESAISEAELFRAHARTAQDTLERPVTAVYDESGLVYGEPLSEGRTVRQKENTR